MKSVDDQARGGEPAAAALAERISLSLSAAAYARGKIRLTDALPGERTHVVASRQGLYAVDRSGWTLIAHGMFFGMTRRDDETFYAFECCDVPTAPSRMGRIVRLRIVDGRIAAADVMAQGLDNGCHQIEYVGGLLCVTDTYGQRILAYDDAFAPVEIPQPFKPVARREWMLGYHHLNTILPVEDRILILLHNGTRETGRPSAIAVLDRDWRILGQWTLAAGGCHDLAVLADGTLISCGSATGELITLAGRRKTLSPVMTRGLSVEPDGIVVGSSTFAARHARLATPGSVMFLNADWEMEAEIPLPGAPTAIMRRAGADWTLPGTLGPETAGSGTAGPETITGVPRMPDRALEPWREEPGGD
ncbi:MAG: hypothetical protein JWN66_2630 [Sphingomonas bacterium]|uniref:hypothetical protein n=1 Tax=Sphingomonas bacterium TaxID=1895847 RepID=UPI002602F97A|nr:hypothetical protein [Sphingomonas bacterium]MDB5705514.1 hypothetical protein [Sphingomonas bacterium]